MCTGLLVNIVVDKTTAWQRLLGHSWPGTKWRAYWCIFMPSLWW